ncbi:MAG: Spy/CpxP family protein refolding chaperone [Spirochaetes bacterium]|nr:Spy/CpxP family protein refolding chaperone [Spirochaetota bacterium]
MTKKTKVWVIIAVVAILVGIGIFKWIHYSWIFGSPAEKAEWIVKKISKKLDLNKDQKDVLNNIKDEILAKTGKFRELHKGVLEQLSTQIGKPVFDQNAVNKTLAQKESQFKALRIFMVSKIAKFHSILTPHQRKLLVKKLNYFHHKWMKRRHGCRRKY